MLKQSPLSIQTINQNRFVSILIHYGICRERDSNVSCKQEMVEMNTVTHLRVINILNGKVMSE